mgnify:CR=1 FL=1
MNWLTFDMESTLVLVGDGFTDWMGLASWTEQCKSKPRLL